MPVQSSHVFERILMNLSILRYLFKSKSKQGHYDLNKKSESFFRDLLNLIYGFDLQNMNSIQKNYPAIDLGDTHGKVCVQVTAQNNSGKIKKTIAKFIEKKLFNDYRRLTFLLLTEKKSYTTDFETGANFDFDPKTDILDIDDILTKMENFDLENLEKIDAFIQSEVKPIFATLAAPGSLFYGTEQRVETAPSNADKFLESLGYEANEYEEERKAEFKSILKAYNRLRELSETARGYLATIISRGKVNENSGYGKIYIVQRELLNLTPNISKEEARQHFHILVDAGVADVEDDDNIAYAYLSLKLESGYDFFVAIKSFCTDQQKIKRIIEDCDFSLLD